MKLYWNILTWLWDDLVDDDEPPTRNMFGKVIPQISCPPPADLHRWRMWRSSWRIRTPMPRPTPWQLPLPRVVEVRLRRRRRRPETHQDEARKMETNAGFIMIYWEFTKKTHGDFMGYIGDVMKCKGTVLGVLFCGSLCALNWMFPYVSVVSAVPFADRETFKESGQLSATMSIYIYS